MVGVSVNNMSLPASKRPSPEAFQAQLEVVEVRSLPIYHSRRTVAFAYNLQVGAQNLFGRVCTAIGHVRQQMPFSPEALEARFQVVEV